MTVIAARQTAAAALTALALAVAGCGQAATPGAHSATARQASAAATTGDIPSDSAKMICEPEAELEIAAAIGAQTSQPPTPTWADRLYSCRYTYPTAAMVLSIKEFPDEATTSAYYSATQNSVPGRTAIQVLGQSGFVGPDGSTYVRKDFKVLHIDVSALPDHFGQPPHTRPDVAFTVAAVIMTCWTGS